MKVQEAMTLLVHTSHPDDTLDRAARLLWEHDCGAVPVVDSHDVLRGVITDRDICMGAYTQGLPLQEMRVSDSMSRRLVTVKPDDSLEDAARTMARERVRRLPVVDTQGKLHGLLSIADLGRTLQPTDLQVVMVAVTSPHDVEPDTVIVPRAKTKPTAKATRKSSTAKKAATKKPAAKKKATTTKSTKKK